MNIPEDLVLFAQALVDDESLGLWYESLADLPAPERAAELQGVARRIGSGEGHETLAHATSLLTVPGLYEAVLEAVRVLRGEG